MRKVQIPKGMTPPADWLAEAEDASKALRQAQTEDERKAVIERHEKLWRDERVRGWLLNLFHAKCWYSEAKDSVSSYHVDHFRPKGRVTDLNRENPEPGYWWLAFDWKNYRISGQLINSKKADVFPLRAGRRATCDEPDSLELEYPTLLDPVSDDACLISFEMDEDGCRAVAAVDAEPEQVLRASATIEAIGLNRLDGLNANRAFVWRACAAELTRYEAAKGDSHWLRRVQHALAIARLTEMIGYDQEFSSVALACIRKLGGPVVNAKVFEEAVHRAAAKAA